MSTAIRAPSARNKDEKEFPAWADATGSDRHNLTVYAVKGSLLALDSREREYSVELGDEVISEYKLELICDEEQVDELVGIIQRTARTGQTEAGWIYVVDIASAAPIE